VTRIATVTAVAGVLVLASMATAVAQRRGGFGGGGFRGRAEPVLPNASYDGRFTFVRLRYGPAME